MRFALCAPLIVLLCASCGGDPPNTPTSTPPPSPTAFATAASGEQQAVIDVVNQFAQALASGNAPVLYELQTESFRQGCSYDEFQEVVGALTAEQLMGPVTAAINGELALASLFFESGAPARLTLRREVDGSWRVVTAGPAVCA